MGSKERRQRHREELRVRILDAAANLLIAEGVESVTMRRVAELIEYSPTAIYSHFEDKDALLDELGSKHLSVLVRDMERAALLPDLRGRVDAACSAYLEFGLGCPEIYRLIFTTRGGSETRRLLERAYALIKDIVTASGTNDGRREPEVDTDFCAQMMWSTMHGLVALEADRATLSWVAWQPISEKGRFVVDYLVAMLGQTSSSTKDAVA